MSAHLVEEGVADLVVRLVASEEARENPYPLYAALRDCGPILDTGLVVHRQLLDPAVIGSGSVSPTRSTL